MSLGNCGFCGDPIPDSPGLHVCWLASHYAAQNTVEPDPVQAEEPLQDPLDDEKVPYHIKRVDLSNF